MKILLFVVFSLFILKKENDHAEDKLNLVNAQPIVWYTYQYDLLKQRFQLPLGLNGPYY